MQKRFASVFLVLFVIAAISFVIYFGLQPSPDTPAQVSTKELVRRFRATVVTRAVTGIAREVGNAKVEAGEEFGSYLVSLKQDHVPDIQILIEAPSWLSLGSGVGDVVVLGSYTQKELDTNDGAYVSCWDCGVSNPPEEFREMLDDILEEALAELEGKGKH